MLDAAVRPDLSALPAALNSCARLGDLRAGTTLHQHSLRAGRRADRFVQAALVHMYAKCGRVRDARKVFDQMHLRDPVYWTSMLSDYANNRCTTDTLELFRLMSSNGHRPNGVALLGTISVCAHAGTSRTGESLRGYAVRSAYISDLSVATAIIDMYAKSGSLEAAQAVFNALQAKDVCCSTMIACYGIHGHARDAMHVFSTRIDDGIEPNDATFTGILSACSHSGLLDEGRSYFESMHRLYQVAPTLKHYSCMVDLLGRADNLREEEDLIAEMPVATDARMWGSLLAACQVHGNLEAAERLAERVLELDFSHAGYYMLVSNIYAAKSRWGDVERIRGLMRSREMGKEQGLSLIEIGGCIHKFSVGESSHPDMEVINSYLWELDGLVREMGYVPMTEFALHDVEEEALLARHSERLAVAYGLLKTRKNGVIRVVKNLRICRNCHGWTKVVSRVSGRVIVVRDVKRFHQFEGCEDVITGYLFELHE